MLLKSKLNTVINKLIFRLISNGDILGFIAMKYDNTVFKFSDDRIARINKDNIFITNNHNLMTYDTIEYIYLKQLLHLRFFHHRRMKNKNPFIWAFAVSAEVNEIILNYYSHIKIPEILDTTIYNFADIVAEFNLKNNNINTAEELYYQLIKKFSDLSTEEIVDKIKYNYNVLNDIMLNADYGKNFITDEDDDNELLQNIAENVNNSITEYQTNKMRSREENAEKSINKILDKIYFYKKMQTVLQNLITRIDSSIGYNNGFRTYAQRNYIIKKIPGIKKFGKVIKGLIICIDESGSMTDEEIAKVIYSIFETMKKQTYNIKQLILIRHDTKIHVQEFENINNASDLDQYVRIKDGGTSHAEVYDFLLNKYNENKIKFLKDFSTIIFITDGYSDIEEFDWHKIPLEKIWLITDHDNIDNMKSIEKICGKVIDVRDLI